MIEMKGKDWRPYSPDAFLCPSHSQATYRSIVPKKWWFVPEKLYEFNLPGMSILVQKLNWSQEALTEINNMDDPVINKISDFLPKQPKMARYFKGYGGISISRPINVPFGSGRQVARANQFIKNLSSTYR